MVRGYDFLVNSVWPEVVSNIEARTSSIFAPGNPDIFHAVRTYMTKVQLSTFLEHKTVSLFKHVFWVLKRTVL